MDESENIAFRMKNVGKYLKFVFKQSCMLQKEVKN